MKGLTKRQKEMVDFLNLFISEKGYAPSYREVQNHFGFASVASVYKHLLALKNKGVIHHDTKRSRSVEPIVDSSEEVIKLSIDGRISPGKPYNPEPTGDLYPVPKLFIESVEQAFLIEVSGDSLKEDEQMVDGDLLLLDPSRQSEGDLVLATIDGYVVVGCVHEQDGMIHIEASHRESVPLIVPKETTKFIGRILYLFRKYAG